MPKYEVIACASRMDGTGFFAIFRTRRIMRSAVRRLIVVKRWFIR